MSCLRFFRPKAKIVEVFRSIQGEGKYIGVPQVFVRFHGCRFQCSWCDTPEAREKKEFQSYFAEALVEEILGLCQAVHSVSLTGGEPLEQKDFLKEFLPLCKKKNLRIYLETNGILHDALREVAEFIDIVAMDVKLPSSTRQGSFWAEHEACLRVVGRKEVFIKVVISAETLETDILAAAKLASKINRDMIFILQPNYFDMNNAIMKKCCEAQTKCFAFLNDVRVIPQIHKMVGVR